MIRRALSSLVALALAALSLVPAADARRVFLTKGYSGAPYTYNITSANTSSFRTVAIAHARNAIAATEGDSTMRGVNENALPYNSQYPNAMPMQLAALLNAAGINAGANNWYGVSGTTLNDYLIRDSRVVSTGADAFGSQTIQGGANIIFNAGASTFSFTPQFNCTTEDIYWRNGSVGNTFSYAVDGGSPTNLATTGTGAFVKTTISLGTAGIHTTLLSQVLGSPQIYGIDCQDATAGRTEITIRQWGISGATSAFMISNVGTPGAGRILQFQTYPTDLVICECGLVNSWRLSESVAQSKSDMTTLVQAVKATGSNFLFLTPPFDNSSTGLAANQNAYVTAMYQVAAEQGVGLIDIRQKWVSYANAVANGWQSSNDSVHPALAGYIDEAQVIFKVIQSILNNTFAGFPQLPMPSNDNDVVLYHERRAA